MAEANGKGEDQRKRVVSDKILDHAPLRIGLKRDLQCAIEPSKTIPRLDSAKLKDPKILQSSAPTWAARTSHAGTPNINDRYHATATML